MKAGVCENSPEPGRKKICWKLAADTLKKPCKEYGLQENLRRITPHLVSLGKKPRKTESTGRGSGKGPLTGLNRK